MQDSIKRVSLKFSIPLLGVLFFHLLCESMVVPILVPMLTNPPSSSLDLLAGHSIATRNLLYGIVLASYPICVFLFAPIIGAYSDSIGRRKILLFAIAISAFACAFHTVGVIALSFSIFLISRCILGASAGIDGSIQAALVARCSSENQKNFYLGATLLAMSLGFMVGPAFSAIFIDDNASVFIWSLPFFFCAIFFLFCLIVLFISLPKDSIKISKSERPKVLRIFGDISDLFKDTHTRPLLWIFILTQTASGCFTAALPLILDSDYGFSPRMLAFFISVGGVFAGLIFTPIGPFLLKKFSGMNVLRFSIFTTLAILTIPFFDVGIFIWIIPPIMSFAFPLGYYTSVSMFSQASSESRRGWVLSILSGLWGLTVGIGLFLCGLLGMFDVIYALIFSLLIVMFAIPFAFVKSH